MFTWVSRIVGAARRSGLRGGVVLTGAAVLAGDVFAGPASAATVPRPTAGLVPGMSTAAPGAAQDQIRVFYQQVNHSLITKSSTATGGWGAPQNLGGVLTSGPAAITIWSGDTYVLARGTDQKVWYRVYRSGSGTWNGWAPLGGMWQPLTIGAPGVSDGVVCVRGTDNALWMNVRPYRPYAWQGWQGWHRVGGVLTSAPAAGVFPRAPLTRSVLALGGDGVLWQGRNRVGTSTWAWTQVP